MSNPYNCVDVSEWNGDIDWKKAAEDDVRYAFIRCGFGQDKEYIISDAEILKCIDEFVEKRVADILDINNAKH